MSWFDNKKLSLGVDAISWNSLSLSKKKKKKTLYFFLCVKNPNLSLQIAKIKILTLRSRKCDKQFNLPWSNVKSSNFIQESKWPKCSMLTKLWLSWPTIKLK